jgi:4-amino-4-deoxy-L-arabinose transferase-like glycosyltransferase
MLDIFMIFFAILGLYLVITATGGLRLYLAAGISFGFALACKSNAIFFVIPMLIFLIFERKLQELIVLLVPTAFGYVASYSRLLMSEGLHGFLISQSYMLSFMYKLHVESGSSNLLTRALTPLIFHTTTLAPTTSFGGCPPNFLGLPFTSIAEIVNTPLLLLLFPVLFWLLRSRSSEPHERRRAIHVLILAIVSFLIYEAMFPNTIGAWYFAPIGTLTAIAAPAMLQEFQKRNAQSKSLTFLYLTLLTTWLIYANAIYMACGVS